MTLIIFLFEVIFRSIFWICICKITRKKTTYLIADHYVIVKFVLYYFFSFGKNYSNAYIILSNPSRNNHYRVNDKI